ncbi:N-acetylmuramoyl-L-alanine amidase [Fructilactobacillus sanfranciscensis]|uniref:N-acetylmuramoyl-L-alanine amidase n=1 Tax=Fructilactobacillus sanfranciscensis TaxID=1625 RepID=UPI000CD4130B|nr:N-acetylmuramoyl-L-alanine amidase [Fructilactobacillus sanfranciscensis]POH15697.1 N-acetylmuramoyl-L-alanine amidase [Fructilactobacillus sanfranciscensis]
MKINIKNKRGFTFTLIVTSITLLILIILLLRNNVMIHCNNLQVKSGPNISYQTTGKINAGTRVQILNRQDNWDRVVYDHSKIGWIPDWLVNNKTLKEATNLSETTVVLDPGHGGSDSGALSTGNNMEKTYTLQVAKKAAKQLQEKEANVIMTRDSDKTVSLFSRPSFSTDNNANLFISFHFDSSPENNTASGFTSYYYHKGLSLKLATDINRQMENIPIDNRGIEFGNFLVIRDVKVPSILLEMGYINDDDDFKHIENQQYQETVAQDVENGVNNYINSTY